MLSFDPKKTCYLFFFANKKNMSSNCSQVVLKKGGSYA